MENITRDNLDQYYDKMPIGYELASRGRSGMTEKARNLIKSYWNNVVNEKEARQDAKNDRAAGLDHRPAEKWAEKYLMHQWKITGLLVQGKFIKKIR